MTHRKGNMKFLFSMLVLAVFAAGVGIGSLIGVEMPAHDMQVETHTATSRGLQFNTVKLAEPTTQDVPQLKATAQQPNLEGPVERDSPAIWIPENQIEMRQDGVFIHFNNPQWAILADTNSMDPVFDAGSHILQIIPTSKEQVHVGDIISYDAPLGFSIIHRVREIGSDEQGWYAIVKGDNNPTPDPWKVRFDMITRITVGIIY